MLINCLKKKCFFKQIIQQRRTILDLFGNFSIAVSSNNEEHEKNIDYFINVASIQNYASSCLHDLHISQSRRVRLICLERLVDYMKIHPLARQRVFKDGGISKVLTIRDANNDKEIHRHCQLALALLGYVDPVKQNGIRILAIDGGGTRGVMAIEMLKKISDLCQQPIHELFDLIVGTSTGAIIAFLIGIQQQPLSKCEKLYERLSKEIFDTNQFIGAGKLFLEHAYYDETKIEEIFKNELGENALIDSAASGGPKVCAVSTLVSEQVLQAYAFRNYCLRFDTKNVYAGSSKHKSWQALRASSAAPGFFKEYVLDGNVHQDGGLLTNNPCALAIHEAKALWPKTPIQAVISIGTGSYHGRAAPRPVHFTTLRQKLMKLVASATDVEAVHSILQDLLPADKYVRLNPNMSADVPLDECQPEVLRQLEQDTRNYIDKFGHKFNTAATALLTRKTRYRKFAEKIELKLAMKGLK